MEIAMTISSLSNMPQAFTEITAADEAGGIQGKGAQSPSFGLLFDQWAGMAEGERLPGDSGSNKFSQSPLREESPAELATGGAQRNDPSQGPLLRVTDTFTAGKFTMAAAAPDRTVQQLPEQTAADSGASDTGKEVNSAAGPTPGERWSSGNIDPADASRIAAKDRERRQCRRNHNGYFWEVASRGSAKSANPVRKPRCTQYDCGVADFGKGKGSFSRFPASGETA